MKKLLLLFAVLLSTVSGWAQVLGTSIDVDKVYTLNCKGDHIAFLAYSGSAFTGNSSTPGYLVFEKGPQDNQYYIKNYPDQKYLSYVESAFCATDNPTTLWQIGTYTHTANVISLACVGKTDMYIMNNPQLSLVSASGGPSNKQRCFLWELREASPEIESGKVYRIINKANEGKTIGEGADFLLNVNDKNESALSQMWYVEGNNKDGYSLRNLSTADYFDYVDANYTNWKTSATPKKYYIAKGEAASAVAPDYYYITFNATAAPETLASAHYSGGRVVRWRWSDKTDGVYTNVGASLWQFEEVDVDALEKMDLAYSSWYTELSGLTGQASELVSTGGYAESKVTLTEENTTCPAAITDNSDGGGVAALLDDNNDTFMHTKYDGKGSVGEPHYIQVDLGEGNTSKYIVFSYRARHNTQNNNPETIIVKGSTDGTNFEDIQTLTNLPDGLIDYTSNPVGNGTAYRYFRFVVTETTNNAKHEGYVFFSLAKFRMSTVSVADTYASKVIVLKKMNDLVPSISFDENRPEDWTTIATKDLVPQLQALIYGATIREYTSFELTKNANEPICYFIKSGRSKDWSGNYYWTFKDGKVTTITANDNYEKDVEAYWFFMENPQTGMLQIVPFIENMKPMGYTTVEGGADKLTNNAAASGFVGTDYTLVTETANTNYGSEYPYALKAYGTDYYVSNHGGSGSTYMGFYDGLNDGGTRIAIEKAEITPSAKLRDLRAALASCPVDDSNARDELGYYNVDKYNEYKPIVESARATYEDATLTDEQYQEEIASLSTAATLLEINLPETKRFYRFSHDFGDNVGNLYVQAKASNVASKANAMLMSDENGASSIFYYADGKLLSYSEGLYVNEEGSTRGLQSVGSTAGAASFEPGTVIGQLGVFSGNSFHANTSGEVRFVDHCGTVHSADHNFTVEPVETLPFTFKGAALGYATFNAPVNVDLSGTGVVAYIAEIIENESKLKIRRIEGSVVPANTPVLLYNKDVTSDDVSVNFNIDNVTCGFTAKDLEPQNNFYGTLAAEVTPTGENVYSLQKGSTEVGFFKKSATTTGETPTPTTMAGFKAWIKTPNTPDAARSFTIIFDGDNATGLKEVLGLENENVEIYDLSGRRLDKPAKGVNVIGGKLVVK